MRGRRGGMVCSQQPRHVVVDLSVLDNEVLHSNRRRMMNAPGSLGNREASWRLGGPFLVEADGYENYNYPSLPDISCA